MSTNLYAKKNIFSDTEMEITGLLVYAHEEPLNPTYSKTMLVKFNGIPWSTTETQCNSNGVAIKEEDVHMVSILLAAYISGKKIKHLYVKDDVNNLDGYCYLRAFNM